MMVSGVGGRALEFPVAGVTMVTLYHHPFCPHSRFVRLALAALVHGQEDRFVRGIGVHAARPVVELLLVAPRAGLRVQELIAVLLDSVPALPEERLAHEAALVVAKADIREELDRLTAHLDAARMLLAEGGPIGRRFDFLCQEFNREANTLCSKSADLELTRIGLALKAAIEQLREQVQNIE